MEAKIIQKYKSKSLPALRRTAKTWFNKFIRLRDTDDYGYGNCISSGQGLKYGNEMCQAGHFYSGGDFPSLEFHEHNVNLQGKSDNYFNGANLLQYRKNLINKIGIEAVEELELLAAASKRKPFKHDRFRFIEVIEEYKGKCKILLKDKMF